MQQGRATPHTDLNACYIGFGISTASTLYQVDGCRGMIVEQTPAFRSASAERRFPTILNQHGGEGRQVFRLVPTEQMLLPRGGGAGTSCAGICSVCPQLAAKSFVELTRWDRVRACWYVFDMESGDVSISALKALVSTNKIPASEAVNNIFVPYCMGPPRPTKAGESCGVDSLGRTNRSCPRIAWHADCMDFFYTSMMSDQRDKLMRQYCNVYPEAPACDCLAAISSSCRCDGSDEDERCDVRCASRGIVVDPLSKTARVSADLSAFIASPLSCWYQPCQEQTQYTFSPSTYADQETNCPDVCGSFLNVDGENTAVDFKNVVIQADCSGTGRNTGEPIKAIRQALQEDIDNEVDVEDAFDFVMYRDWVKTQAEWLIPVAAIMAAAALTLTLIMIASRRKGAFFRGRKGKERKWRKA